MSREGSNTRTHRYSFHTTASGPSPPKPIEVSEVSSQENLNPQTMSFPSNHSQPIDRSDQMSSEQQYHVPNQNSNESNNHNAPLSDNSYPSNTNSVPSTSQATSQSQLNEETNLSVPQFTKSDFESILSDDTSKREMVINNLIMTSDFFLEKAHSIVLTTNNEKGLNNYLKLVKGSIQALLMIVKGYGHLLNSQLQAIIYFKLAKLYFYETENINRAEDYINKAISISTSNNFIKIKFTSEFLASQILNKTNSRVALNYLNDKIDYFNNIGFPTFSNILKFLKVTNLMVIDYNQAMVVLQSLTEDPSIDNITKQLCFLYQINLQLYIGSPLVGLQLLQDVKASQNANQPVQLTAMALLAEYLILIQLNDATNSKVLMKRINSFIVNQQESNWHSWSSAGEFDIDLPLSLNEFQSSSLKFQVNWINSDEFVIMFYFISGIALLYESYNGKRKATKFFSKCTEILNKQLQDISDPTKRRNFPLIELNNRVLRLNYLKIMASYYQCLDGFVSNNFSIDPLKEFIERYSNNQFSKEEECYYSLSIPRILFLLGQYYQSKGQSTIAEYYYKKVRDLTSPFRNNGDIANQMKISVLTMSIGLGADIFSPKGKNSELYVYSVLSLLVITEKDLYNLSHSEDKDNESFFKLAEQRNDLYRDLQLIFSENNKTHGDYEQINSAINRTFVSSDPLLNFTKQLLFLLYQDTSMTEAQATLDHIMKHDSVLALSPFLSSLTFILASNYSSDSIQRTEYLKKAEEFNLINNSKVLQYVTLKSKENDLRRNGQEELADMERARHEQVFKSLALG